MKKLNPEQIKELKNIFNNDNNNNNILDISGSGGF